MTLREQQKEQGRKLIRDAAERLFLSNGYAATPVTAIATAAGVAEKTVYNLFETKSGVLVDLFKDRVAGIGENSTERMHADVRGRVGAVEIIDGFCRVNQLVAARALPLLRIVMEAAATDASVAALLERQEEFRYEDQAYLLDSLETHGHLRTDRSRDELQRTLWLVAAPELVVKVLDNGWDLDRHTQWLRQSLIDLLLPRDQ